MIPSLPHLMKFAVSKSSAPVAGYRRKRKMRSTTRAPKLLGDFGEGLVTYALIRKGFEVACVDHVGADLIAERSPHRIAVSVKTRLYREGTDETRGLVIKYAHVEKLEEFAKRFRLEPVFAHAVCIPDDKIIHLFMLRVA